MTKLQRLFRQAHILAAPLALAAAAAHGESSGTPVHAVGQAAASRAALSGKACCPEGPAQLHRPSAAGGKCSSFRARDQGGICSGTRLARSHSTGATSTHRPAGPVRTVSTRGHEGTESDPYPGASIQAAIDAVPSGGTVFIPAGNWSLAGVRGGQITVSRANITIRGAGSGNVFDQYGHPTYSDSPSGTYTRLFTHNDTNRFVLERAARDITVRDIFFDGATQGKGSGAQRAFLLVINAGPGIQFRNLRVTQSDKTMEACASTFNTPGTAWYDSAFIAPDRHGGLLQTNGSGPTIIKNCFFHNNSWNPIYENDDVMEGCVEMMGPGSNSLASVGITGGGRPADRGKILNSYFDGTGDMAFRGVSGFSIGAGLNDPGYPGTVTNLVVSGNWLVGDTVAIASNIWEMYGSPASIPGAAAGMTVRGFTVDHNSLIATTVARIDFRGTPSGDKPRGSHNSHEAYYVSGARAHHNYLSSPNSQYLTDSFTSSAKASANVGVDVNTSSDTAPPTVATFSLGPPAGTIVPVAMSGRATYGAVMYLINESGNTPSESDSGWTYVPPVSWTLSRSGIAQLYAWTKSAAGHISARASASVPSAHRGGAGARKEP
ncbi:MAG TPA: hypothetical protein VMK12_06735 [Anaeromyxobacteraceae bacterium]|nr:hypothetical protein [Anaeromyxobacteraceae bacterium]